jgi:hypothetical protein
MISLGTWKKPPPSAVFKITVVEGKKKSEPISDLENLVRIYMRLVHPAGVEPVAFRVGEMLG